MEKYLEEEEDEEGRVRARRREESFGEKRQTRTHGDPTAPIPLLKSEKESLRVSKSRPERKEEAKKPLLTQGSTNVSRPGKSAATTSRRERGTCSPCIKV